MYPPIPRLQPLPAADDAPLPLGNPLPLPVPVQPLPTPTPSTPLTPINNAMPFFNPQPALQPQLDEEEDEDECDCSVEPNPSNITARVKAFARRMSQTSLDNLKRGK